VQQIYPDTVNAGSRIGIPIMRIATFSFPLLRMLGTAAEVKTTYYRFSSASGLTTLTGLPSR
jgi:hypothetical protein